MTPRPNGPTTPTERETAQARHAHAMAEAIIARDAARGPWSWPDNPPAFPETEAGAAERRAYWDRQAADLKDAMGVGPLADRAQELTDAYRERWAR